MASLETSPRLRHAQSSGHSLSFAEVRELMTLHERILGAPPNGIEWLRLPTAISLPPLPRSNARPQNLKAAKQLATQRARAEQQRIAEVVDQERRLIEAVSKQLERTLGIPRKESGRRNNWRGKKKATRG